MIANLNYAPPFPGFTHTVLPLFSRDLLVVTQEAVTNGGLDHPKLVWLMDNRLETNPVIVSTLPLGDTEAQFKLPGRYGAHNIYENLPVPGSFASDKYIYARCSTAGFECSILATPSSRRR